MAVLENDHFPHDLMIRSYFYIYCLYTVIDTINGHAPPSTQRATLAVLTDVHFVEISHAIGRLHYVPYDIR